MPGKCKFQNSWLVHEQYKDWILKDSDVYSARCGVCLKSFKIDNMGQSALDSHSKSTGHQTSMKNRSAGEHLEEHLPFVLQNRYRETFFRCFILLEL